MSSMGIPAPPNPARWTFPEESEGWELREETLPDPQDNHVSEEIFSIGNGNIGVRGYPEESSLGVNSPLYGNVESSQGGGATFHTTTSSDKKPHLQHLNSSGVGEMSDFLDSRQGGHPERDIRHSFASNSLSESLSVDESIPRGPIRGFYVSGFTEMHIPASYGHPYSDYHVLNGSYMVRAPDPFCVDVIIGGEHVSPATGRIVSHTRRLNLRTGELYRRMVWESRTSPKEVTIESTRFISAVKNIAATRFAVSARNANHTEIRLISRTTIPNDGKTRAACGVERVSVGATIAAASAMLLVRTPRSCRHLAVATTESCRSFARPRKPLGGGSPSRAGGTSTTASTGLSHGEGMGMGKGGVSPTP
ncbi:unnamed protein product [Phytomonas sp. EM1]|nr:unnamed protein product [Phytomonas sp. EM1]|eukprot:CCW63832.1 unnamed protein product [Phytomonas sp. isolate EM1]